MLLLAFTSICHLLPQVLFQNAVQIMSLPSSKAYLVAQTGKNLPAMQETLVWSLDWEDATEKRMATHSSILAWRIPQTEEPAGLQSIGSPSVRHDWMTNFSSKAISNFPSSLAESLKFCVLPFQALHQLPWALLPLQGTLNMLYPMSQPHPICSVFPFFFLFYFFAFAASFTWTTFFAFVFVIFFIWTTLSFPFPPSLKVTQGLPWWFRW